MSKEPYSIIILPINIIRNSTNVLKESIFELINRGYDKPRFRYNIILTPRIKSVDVLFSDLGFQEDEDKCIIYLLVTDRERSKLVPNFDECFEKTSDCCNSHAVTFYKPRGEKLHHPLTIGHVLATIGYKPVEEDTFEITAFTSFAKGCGKLLANYSILDLQKRFHLLKLRANVIVEHDLVGYYETVLGFEEIDRFRFDLEHSAGFESGIETSTDFHIATLEKVIHDYI